MSDNHVSIRFRHSCAVLIMLLGAAPAAAQQETSTKEPLNQATPSDVKTLAALEARVCGTIQKVNPAVVAVQSGGNAAKGPRNFASGVIISVDGLILTQAHVSHLVDGTNLGKGRKPGDRTKVILADHKEVEAELLGADQTVDVSLLRLVQPGPYPFVPLSDSGALGLGSWVLKLGHPGGYQPGRAPSARLGRVLCLQDGTFYSDCAMTGGDSGGPFFDLDGRLIGLPRNSAGVDKLFLMSQGNPSRRLNGQLACSTSNLIQSRIESMRRNELKPVDGAAAGKLLARLASADLLPVGKWSQGEQIARAYMSAVSDARKSVVTIRSDQGEVALGSVVAADGWIITKASELPASPRCELANGKILDAKVVGVDPAFDLAMLKITAADLRPITWAEPGTTAPGTMVYAAGKQDVPVAVGIVSVSPRDVAGNPPTELVRRPRALASLLQLIGSPVQGRGYWIEYVEGQVAAAGLRPGDVILTIAGKEVRSDVDLVEAIKGRLSGEFVPLRFLRAGQTMEVTLPLLAEGQSPFSYRSDRFPTVFEHDMPLMVPECGGPVIGLDGKALGITIARVGPHGCVAIPADCVQRLLPDLKAGKLAGNWRAPAAVAGVSNKPKSGKPVTMTLTELKEKLSARNGRFQSVLVEYEVDTEAHVEPQQLMSWNLHHLRSHEVHRIAFAGSKRLTQVSQSPVSFYHAPQDLVVADSNAPADVANAIAQQRAAAIKRKEEGGLGHLFLKPNARTRYVFDGTKCARWDAFRGAMAPIGADRFYAPIMYLANLGLRPLDPRPDTEQQKIQQQFWFPDQLALYDQCRVHPTEEYVDEAACIRLDAERKLPVDGRQTTSIDTFWLDPKIGFAPRRWERKSDGRFQERRENRDFEEFSPGCWLPWESTWSIGTPSWVAPELRDRPAYSFNMRLRKARVNEAIDAIFAP